MAATGTMADNIGLVILAPFAGFLINGIFLGGVGAPPPP